MSSEKRFSHHQEDVWQKLSDGIGGEFLDKEGWRNDKVVTHVDQWSVVFDLFSEVGYKSETIFTRLRAFVHQKDSLEFTIHHRDLLSRIAKWFGAHDVELADEELMKKIVVKGSDPERVAAMLNQPSIVERLHAEPDVYVHLGAAEATASGESRFGQRELRIMVEGEVNELARLQTLFELMADMLHAL